MGIRDRFEKLAAKLQAPRQPDPPDRDAAGEMKQAERSLEALEAGLLNPPEDRRDTHGWDRYWQNHLDAGLMEQGFADMMSSDPQLPALMRRRQAHSVLCAGIGLSMEATALALLGFEVTALDISSVPARMFRQSLANPGPLLRNAPGCVFDLDHGRVTFDDTFQVDPEGCPPIHRSPDLLPRGGGALTYVTGDLMDGAICPGPFDVVIERRTVQLLPDDDQRTAYLRLVGRLADRGLFVSHQHCGHWRGENREPQGAARRLAYLQYSTG